MLRHNEDTNIQKYTDDQEGRVRQNDRLLGIMTQIYTYGSHPIGTQGQSVVQPSSAKLIFNKAAYRSNSKKAYYKS